MVFENLTRVDDNTKFSSIILLPGHPNHVRFHERILFDKLTVAFDTLVLDEGKNILKARFFGFHMHHITPLVILFSISHNILYIHLCRKMFEIELERLKNTDKIDLSLGLDKDEISLFKNIGDEICFWMENSIFDSINNNFLSVNEESFPNLVPSCSYDFSKFETEDSYDFIKDLPINFSSRYSSLLSERIAHELKSRYDFDIIAYFQEKGWITELTKFKK